MTLEIIKNKILADHCTFGIGGPAKYFAVVKSQEELKEALDFVKEKNLSFFVLGEGSNVLFPDEGFKGLVIKISNNEFQISDYKATVGAGKTLAQLVRESVNKGFTGLEWLVGIPGTIGGGVACNCGAFDYSISEFVVSVSIMDKEGKIKKYSHKECEFDYRHSRFKENQNQEIIWEVELKLEKGDKKESEKIIKEILEKRKERIPSQRSSGSFFKNIVIDKLRNKADFLKLVPQEKIQGGKFPAGYLIESCGLKGRRIGDAQISEKHANFIVNLDKAKIEEVKELIKIIKEKVKEKFDLELEEETIIL